ncbi:hypothetical protein [Ancylomarina longa]|uniref:Uncharacterized protein n=1 Tax=Ancylomarina longa TaxID=2487017 RepID=A0A434AWN8_9BACT|nr:hypothetical protein [Ancylomarina longa]RUT78921.1 hypothetical protein DLK05_05410 [Ancylomarina longa]
MKNWIIAFLIVWNYTPVFAQENLSKAENEIYQDFENLLQADADSLKLSICYNIQETLKNILLQPKSFDYPFSSLNRMGKLFSPDQAFRIYNWNCVLADGTYRYYGLIQLQKRGKLQVEVWTDSCIDHGMESQQIAINWMGALYYKVIPFRVKDGEAYVLLGWDGNNYITNKKIIEILSFDKNGKSQFGKPIIYWRGKMLNRVVFEYAKQARMSVQYQEKEKRIVFDHLAPSSPNYQNQFEYYGPDLSYDALVYKNGFWRLVENIDVRNK